MRVDTKLYYIYPNCTDPGVHFVRTTAEENAQVRCHTSLHERYVSTPGSCPFCQTVHRGSKALLSMRILPVYYCMWSTEDPIQRVSSTRWPSPKRKVFSDRYFSIWKMRSTTREKTIMDTLPQSDCLPTINQRKHVTGFRISLAGVPRPYTNCPIPEAHRTMRTICLNSDMSLLPTASRSDTRPYMRKARLQGFRLGEMHTHALMPIA